MIEKLMTFFAKHMMPTKILWKYATAKNRIYHGLMIIYFVILLLGLPLIVGLFLQNPWWNVMVIPLFSFLLWDYYRFRKKKGLGRKIETLSDRANLKVMEPYKQDFGIEFQTVSEAIDKVQQCLFQQFCDQHQMEADYNTLLSALRHREGAMRSLAIFLYSGVLITVIVVIRYTLEFFIPLDKFKTQWAALIQARETTPEIREALSAIGTLVGLQGFLVIVIALFLYGMLVKGYLIYKFSGIQKLQQFLEDRTLQKKSRY